jgi:hypothetical protein
MKNSTSSRDTPHHTTTEETPKKHKKTNKENI